MTLSQSQAHIRVGPSRVGGTNTSDDPLAEEAEYDAATAGAPEMTKMRPRSFRGQLQQFEQSVMHRLDLLDACLDTLDDHHDQQRTMLAQILSLLQMQQPPPLDS